MGWLRQQGLASDAPEAEPTYHEISASERVCGRSTAVDWTIDDPSLSRRHARFYRKGDRDYVDDLSSTNGTAVNGERVRGPRPLVDGDEVRLGDCRFSYELLAPVHLAETPVPTAAPTWAVEEPASESGPEAPPFFFVNESTQGGDPEPLRDTERWTGVELIGRGGMGEVYRAFDRDLGAVVAIKRLRDLGDESRGILERLHAREAAIARTIRHPNVVQVLEDGVHEGDPYMLLEWIQGPTFDRYLAQSTSALGDRVECLRQVALGLAAAHAAGVVHADLKPANILVTEATGVKPKDNSNILESLDAADEEDGDDAALQAEIARRLGTPAVPDCRNSPFVGREGELALLEEIAREVRAEGDGARRWVILFGERGAGKRRLCEEFRGVLRDRGSSLGIEISEEWGPPPPEFVGIWLSMFPPLLPDTPELLAAYERERFAGTSSEIYLKPLLRGQAIRLVERIVNHPPSAREFIDVVDAEIGGNPARLVERLERSFEQGAWVVSGLGYRLESEVLSPDETAAARRLIERLPAEEKGLRDFLTSISPLGGDLDFESMLAASELPSATLYYLIDHAVEANFLVRDRCGDCSIAVEPFRLFLESKVDSKMGANIAKRALPRLHERIAAGTAPASLHFRVGRLERQLDRPDRAFRVLLSGALRARETYERELFLACVDSAREVYRETVSKRAVHRVITRALEEFLGAEGRGYAALERLRRLPIAVRVLLTDFGVSRKLVTGETTQQVDAGQPWGTPRYMSPEQAKRSVLSPASDVFSLGTILREAFEGRHPLGKLRGRAAIAALLGGGVKPPQPSDVGAAVPDELRSLVTRMLSYEAKERPSATEVARALEQFQLRAALEVYP